jgi:hybrid cluster-associated redox disulfide protein
MVTVVAWLALLVALIAAGMVWKLTGELATATRRLDRYNKALFDAADEVRQVRESTQIEIAKLTAALRRQTGEPVFTPHMTVRAALATHPQAEQVMAAFHLGGCSHCAVEPDDTLAHACAQHGVDAAALVANLNVLMGGHTNGRAATPALVKLPNVQLEL